MYKVDMCRAFKELAFSHGNEILRRWEKKELRVLLWGNTSEVSYAQTYLTKFGVAAQKKVLFIDEDFDEDVDIVMIFSEDKQKKPISIASKHFSRWVDEEKFKKKIENANVVENWYFHGKEKTPETGERTASIGIYFVTQPKLSRREIEARIYYVVLNSIFPGIKQNLKFTFDDKQVSFNPFNNKDHYEIMKLWYRSDVKVGAEQAGVTANNCGLTK